MSEAWNEGPGRRARTPYFREQERMAQGTVETLAGRAILTLTCIEDQTPTEQYARVIVPPIEGLRLRRLSAVCALPVPTPSGPSDYSLQYALATGGGFVTFAQISIPAAQAANVVVLQEYSLDGSSGFFTPVALIPGSTLWLRGTTNNGHKHTTVTAFFSQDTFRG